MVSDSPIDQSSIHRGIDHQEQGFGRNENDLGHELGVSWYRVGGQKKMTQIWRIRIPSGY